MKNDGKYLLEGTLLSQRKTQRTGRNQINGVEKQFSTFDLVLLEFAPPSPGPLEIPLHVFKETSNNQELGKIDANILRTIDIVRKTDNPKLQIRNNVEGLRGNHGGLTYKSTMRPDHSLSLIGCKYICTHNRCSSVGWIGTEDTHTLRTDSQKEA